MFFHEGAQGNSMYIPVDDPIQRALTEGRNLPPGTDPVNGYVNIDYKGNVQAPESGAAVVMDVFNGDVLALASTPGFDPNLSRAD